MNFGSKKRILLLIFCFNILFRVTEGSSRDNAEIVYPERIHKTRSKRDLSTLIKDEKHEDTLSLKIKNKQENDMILDLKKVDDIHPGSILLRTYNDKGEAVHDNYKPPDCHYSGKIRDNDDSHVFVSTCSGVTGSLDTGTKRYDIEPNDEGGHLFYNVDDELTKILHKLSKNTDVYPMGDYKEDMGVSHSSLEAAKKVRAYKLVNVESQYIPYFTTNDTRYVEMFISADHGMYERYNKDKDLILERVLNAMGQVDKAYQAIDVRLVVVAVEIHTNGPAFTRMEKGGPDLSNFRDYVKNVIKKSAPFKDIRFDNAHLFSHRGWSDCAGMAYVGTICTESSAAVDAWSFSSIAGPTVIIGHEFGHNMNFNHDSGSCKCLTSRGCFMGGSKSSRPGFSNCSMVRLAQKTFACINDYPQHPLTRVCGNGIIEADEECDCGTPENCMKNDPCCEPHNCKLKAEAQCNFINNHHCCDKQCQFKKQGTRCREPNGNCDVPEFCTGVDATCPSDKLLMNGASCGESIKLLKGTTRNKVTPTVLTPRVTARYLKFIPKYWVKGSYACMKLGLLGCSTNEDIGTVPTSIVNSRKYCLTPDVENCDSPIPDGTKLKFLETKNHDCSFPRMKFVHSSNGTLTHQCSGKKVCPSSDKKNIILSSKCEAENSIFVRTEKLSLQHKKSGACLYGPDSWINSNEFATLKGWCQYARTMMVFQNTDCEVPLGVSTGKLLPDSAFTAGSYFSKNENYITDIRLSKSSWCPPNKKEASWFQIDLGKIVDVKVILVGGTYYSQVHLYNLMYSDDGKLWHGYKESGAKLKDMNSYCYEGNCISTYDHECRKLWGAEAKKADDACWNALNTNKDGYGTCSSVSNSSCSQSNIFCGQLQCTSPLEKPFYINYGTSYKTIMKNGKRCSAAVITNSEQVGLGMVQDGTKCGDGKFCKDQACKSFQDHGVKLCAKVGGVVCNGKGRCNSEGKCQCDDGYDPDENCATLTVPVNGVWSEWSSWGKCSHACNTGKHRRHRFCDSPSPKHGGKDCVGKRVEIKDCNKHPCIIARSCKELKIKMEEANQPLYDGVYTIKPKASHTFKVYCDMTRHGGGWTLIVSSHTNSWTADNVRLRNADKPELYDDYSILQYADEIKNSYLIVGSKFEYRLEANSLGRWGGIWRAPITYTMNSNNSEQVDVELLQKFDDWQYSRNGITKRLPYVSKQLITTGTPGNNYGSITDNKPGYHPSKWISGALKMVKPEHVWYWLREGDFGNPKSCLEILYRGFERSQMFKSGVYNIEPIKGKVVQTYCEMERHGGGWTLLTKSSGKEEWSCGATLEKNVEDVSLNQYSIYGMIDALKGNDVGEKSYDYMVEADGDDKNGGMFSFDRTQGLKSPFNKALKPKLIKKFGTWDENVENIAKYPIRFFKNGDIYLGANSGNLEDNSGAIVDNHKDKTYMTTCKNPLVIKIWIRAGGSRRSCNDLRVHGHHKGKDDYTDGYSMLLGSRPVYCDMTSTEKEGWTLLVTSASTGWTPEQVVNRNANHPSIASDYSILDHADSFKNLSNSQFFKYMIDSEKRLHWGGIWKASIKLPFVAHSNAGRDAELIKKFSDWDFETTWWKKNKQKMPFIGKVDRNRSLLSTSNYPQYYDWGSIISEISSVIPSPWILGRSNPGLIWYWVNENDCNADYKKVDGGYSVSEWSSCSVYCGKGIQRRQRECNNPLPRCGGDPCDSSVKLMEERECYGPCATTQIKTVDTEFCFEPESGGCSPADETKVVLSSSDTKCNGDESLYVFNPDKGDILHKCSGKRVCLISGILKVSSKCPLPTDLSHFMRTQWESIYFKNGALAPNSWSLRDGNYIVKSSGAMHEKQKFVFTNRTYLLISRGVKMCPASHPYVYLSGRYCCRYDTENGKAGDTAGCDGSKISFSSECCKHHGYKKCDTQPCQNFDKDVKTADVCMLKAGSAVGGGLIDVGKIASKKECFAECYKKKKDDSSINGMTVLSSGEPGCWCVKAMKTWSLDKKYMSCKEVNGISDYRYGHVNSSFFSDVRVQTIDEFLQDVRYPSNPTAAGYIDNLATPSSVSGSYAMQLRSYFKAPVTGYYTFFAACDDRCRVYLSENTDPSSRNQIVDVTRWANEYQWDASSSQKSELILLNAGKQYYIESLLTETGGGDHMEVGVIFPNEKEIKPVTYEYLSNKIE